MSVIGRVAPFLAGETGARTYATWSTTDKDGSVVVSGGDLSAQITVARRGVRANIGKSAGKGYWEITRSAGNAEADIGIATASASLADWLGADAYGVGYDSLDGKLYKSNAAVTGVLAGYSIGDVIRFALDQDAKTLAVYKGPTLLATYSHGLTGAVFPAIGDYAAGNTWVANFGASAFAYSPPAGFPDGFYS